MISPSLDPRRLGTCVQNAAPLAEGLLNRLDAATRDTIGITRASYSNKEQLAHDLCQEIARELGLEVSSDRAGNTYMTWPGADPQAKAVVIGSHLDSVPQGGNFDGAAGVVAGLVAVAALKEIGFQPQRPLQVMGIRAEESAWFGVSYIGSRAALGQIPPGALDSARRIDTGRSLRDHMKEAGFDPASVEDNPTLQPETLKAYLELHIEQGPVLETEQIPAAVVTGIRGNCRLPRARCLGSYAHCGGMPRAYRYDAVIATTDLIAELDASWDRFDATDRDFAFTCGKLFTNPGRHAMTTISGETTFSLDMRSLDNDLLDEMQAHVETTMRRIEEKRGVTFEHEPFTRALPGPMAPHLQQHMREAARALQLPARDLASGASHDAAAFAAAGVPTAMVFVRNANGSHNPDEAMEIQDFLEATKMLTWAAALELAS